MRFAHLLTLGLIAGSLVASPSVSHAAGYKHLVSKSCPYSIDYAAGWKLRSDRSRGVPSDTFSVDYSSTRFAQILVICTPGRTRASTQQLTAAQMRAFKKQGYVLSTPKYSSGVGIFTGHKRVSLGGQPLTVTLEMTTFNHSLRGWFIYLLSDAATFKQAFPLYFHMLGSFNSR